MPQVSVETDEVKRDAISDAGLADRCTDDVSYIPLHQQALSWGVSKKIKSCSGRTIRCSFHWVKKD